MMEIDGKWLKKYVDKRFILKLIGLFNSEDPRERDYLGIILHRIYEICPGFRSFIRNAISNVLYEVIHSGLRHNGAAKLLEIIGLIINGFKLPLKEKHILLLHNVLIPLQKVPFLYRFQADLAYCLTQFVEKDSSLASSVLCGMIKFWPKTSGKKTIYYLNQLEEILELTKSHQLQTFIEPVFRKISESIASDHFQVAERALFLWNNDIIASFTCDFKEKVLPIIYPALQKNYSKHWNSTVSSLTLNIIRIFKEMDRDLYDKVTKNYKNNQESKSMDIKQQNRDLKWKAIRELSINNKRKLLK